MQTSAFNKTLNQLTYLYENGLNEQLISEFDTCVAALGGYGAAPSKNKQALLRLLPLKWDVYSYLYRANDRLPDMAAFIEANEEDIELYAQQVSVMRERNILYLFEDLIGVSLCSNRAILTQKIRLCYQQNQLDYALNFTGNFLNCSGPIPAYEKKINIHLQAAAQTINVNESHLQACTVHERDNGSIEFDASFKQGNQMLHLRLPYMHETTMTVDGVLQLNENNGDHESVINTRINGNAVKAFRNYSPYGLVYHGQGLSIQVNNVHAFDW